MMRRFAFAFFAVAVVICAAPVAHGQCVSLTTLGTPYNQNFDTLSNTAGTTTNNLTIPGWFINETGGGPVDNEQYAVDDGNLAPGDTYSYGGPGSPERALGMLFDPGLTSTIGACFTNNTGATITQLSIGYTGEEWRLGALGRGDVLRFSYSLDATSLTTGTWQPVLSFDFSSPVQTPVGPKDGNAAANRVVMPPRPIFPLGIANGADFWIRWEDSNATAADDGLAIDDFSLTPFAASPCVMLNTLGLAHTQNFDTLSSAAGTTTNNLTIPGWFFREGLAGTRDNEQYAVDNGNSATGDTYSYGATGNPERALGGLQSGSLTTTIGACFTNNTGVTVSNLNIAYTGEQWRVGTLGRVDRLDFEYSLDANTVTTGTWTAVDPLDFTGPDQGGAVGLRDGNNASFRTAVSSSISPLSIANGATVWIRWNDLNAASNDDGLAVDDFSITPSVLDTAPTVQSTTPPNGATGTALGANINVTFSEPVNVSPGWFSINCTVSGLHAAGESGGPTTFTLDPAVNFVANEVCTVTIDDAFVTDQDANDPPNNMAGDFIWSFDTNPPPPLVINEIDYDQPGTDAAEFIEIRNNGGAPVNLDPVVIELVNGTGTVVYQTIDLPNVNLAPGAYFVVCANNTTTPNCNMDVAPNTDLVQNGAPDAVALRWNGILVDTVSYEGDTGVPYTETSGSGLTDNNSDDFVGLSRLPDGTDTGVNNTDLSLRCITPGAANVATTVPCSAPAILGLSINDVTAAEGQAGTRTFSFTVQLDQPAPPGGVTFDITTADGTAQDDNPATEDNDYVAKTLTVQTIPQNATQYTFDVIVNSDVTVEPNETFFVNVSNVIGAPLGDPQGVGTIQNDDFASITLIHTIQGSGTSSPEVGNVHTIHGIVTGVKSNGFFVQEEDAQAAIEGNLNTSEGIFVFTSSAPPPAAQMGNLVYVTGTVAEFVPSGDPQQPPLTELTSASTVLDTTGNPLPVPVALSPTLPDPAGPFDQLERLEGMRVSAASITVVGPSDGSFNETAGTGTSNGRFHGVITGVPRPFREPGIQPPDLPPSGTIPPIPRWDGNPERLRIESAALGAPLLTVKASDVVGPMQGPLDYGFRGYAILPDGTLSSTVTPGTLPTTVAVPTANEFTVASFNLQRLFDTVDDPNGDPLVTLTAYNNRLAKASIAIRNHLRNPDVIGVQEAEKIEVLQALAAKILADGGPDYDAYLEEGNDVGGIDVGFLVKTDLVPGGVPRVAVTAVTQIGQATTWLDPDDNQPALLNDRPPLVLEGAVNRDSGSSFPIVVIVAHQRSFLGIDSNAPDGLTTEGDRVRKKRQAQAEFLANYIQGRQTSNPAERLVIVGDFNAYEFNDGYVHPMGVIAGTPAPDNETVVPGDGVDLVFPDLINLVNTPPPAERYSYVHEGNAQNIDHALINAALNAAVPARRIEHPRIDADYPDTERNNNATALRISDHDPVVAFFSFPSSGALEFSAANYNVGEATTTFNVTVNRTGGTFGAVGATYTIAAGTAQGADFTAGTGSVNFADGQTSATFPVTIANDAIDEPDQTIALTLSAPTGGATLGAQTTATITIQDDDAPPVFTISDVSVAEGNSGSSNASLDVTMTGATEFTATVNWATADDSATTANNDYTTAGATLTFNTPGTQSIAVPIVGDTTDEPNERLFVNLSGATNATIGDSQGDINIVDDDGTPQVFINDVNFTEGNSGSTSVNLTVTLAGTSSQTITVDFTVVAGTATCCGSDFSAGNGSVIFTVGGPSTQSVQIQVFGDTTYEPDETVSVNLTGATNATIADGLGILTILNDDSAPAGSYTATKTASSSAGAFVTGATVTYTVVLTNNAPFTMPDNPGNELTDVLPAGLSLVGANASSGTTVPNTGTNTVTWNGSLASGGSVTITITAVITASTGTISNQGNAQVDLDNNGSNETTIPTDDPNVAGQQATSFQVSSSGQFTATKSVVVTGSGAGVTYTIVLTNNMPHAQPDNPGDEFIDVLPPQLTITGVGVSSGTLSPDVPNRTVRWNGSIPSGGSVTITIHAAITARNGAAAISNQGTASIDVDNNGSNETNVPTDDPSTGSSGDATVVAAGAAAIPTLSSLMLMLLALLLGAIAVMKMR
jgi:uncharacterized protein